MIHGGMLAGGRVNPDVRSRNSNAMPPSADAMTRLGAAAPRKRKNPPMDMLTSSTMSRNTKKLSAAALKPTVK